MLTKRYIHSILSLSNRFYKAKLVRFYKNSLSNRFYKMIIEGGIFIEIT